MPKYLDTNIQIKTLSYGFQQIQYRNKRLIFFFFFWPCCAACRILFPRPRTEPWPTVSTTTGEPGSSPKDYLKKIKNKKPNHSCNVKSQMHNWMQEILCLAPQWCLTLWGAIVCSPPCSSVQGIFQARILDWVAISYAGISSPPRDQTCISCTFCVGSWFLYH